MPNRSFFPARSAPLVALALAAAVAACGRIIAPPPPTSPPALSETFMVAGHPATVAARAARTMQEYNYATRRFGSDSTWGWRAADSIAARLRYVRPSSDSTRVLVELWGHCAKGEANGCLAGHLKLLHAAMETDDAPPQ